MSEPAPRSPSSPGELFRVFNRLALQGFGGVLTVAQRELVERQRWLDKAALPEMLSLCHVLRGPNAVNLASMIGDRFFGWRGAAAAAGGLAGGLSFVAVIGLNVSGLAGAAATMFGSPLPSTTLAPSATRRGARHRESRGGLAFSTGMTPLTLGLLLVTGWLLPEPACGHVGSALLLAATLQVMLRTRWSPLWPIALGAVVGGVGGVG